MPELPEVEIIKLGLQRKIVGLKIKKIEVITPKSFIGKPKDIEDKKVIKMWRRAKILAIELNGIAVLFHLKMTGQLVWVGDEKFIGGHPTPDMIGELPNKSTRVIFTFNNGSKLYFNDQRRFGWVRIVNIEQSAVNSLFKKLGPEPLEKDFTREILKNKLLKHKSQAVKVALLDQTVVSGLGNIYANEACFEAKIDPRKKVGELSDNEFKSLHRGVRKALREGIAHGGSTRAHFVDPEGHKGYFLDYAKVYGKDKYPCKICGEIIQKIQLKGRGTYFCSSCQKK